VAKIGQRTDVSAGLQFLSLLQSLGVETRRDMDAPFVADAAALKADHTIALGDCFGLALTRRLHGGFETTPADPDASFVTADRGEMSKIKSGGVCPITFIR